MSPFPRFFVLSVAIIGILHAQAQEPLKIYPEKDTYRSQSQREASPTLVVGDNGGFTALLTFQLPDIPTEVIDSVYFAFAPVIDDDINRITRNDVMQFFTCSFDDWQGENLTPLNFPLFEKWLGDYLLTPRNGYGILHTINISDYAKQEAAGDRRVSILFTKRNREFPRFAASEWQEERWRPHLQLFVNQTTATKNYKDQSTAIAIFPNPVSTMLNIKTTAYDINLIHQVNVINMLGASVLQMPLPPGTTQLDLSNLPNGSYLLQVNNGRNIINRRVLVIHN
ncbi:MAG: T9SS type A sorting domain-containing protein [Saprospiraceae bacterium]